MDRLLTLQRQWSGEGQRVLMLCRREFQSANPFAGLENDQAELETVVAAHNSDLCVVGLVGIVDPPRKEIPSVVSICRRAGIRVFMVTGDFALTAAAIARQCGIVTNSSIDSIEDIRAKALEHAPGALADAHGHKKMLADDLGTESIAEPSENVGSLVLSGSELVGLQAEHWDIICKYDEIVFARTTPEQKLFIVQELRARENYVAVTGDGVNDSPALKKADLGIAMNESGSDVSKEAASMILLDDNFASIVKGIEEGRLIFANLKKSIRYTVAHSTPEVIPQILYIIVPLPPMLTSIMILVIDLGFEIFAALTYAWEPAESANGLMKLPPRKPVTMKSIAQLRARNARQPAVPLDAETGQPVAEGRVARIIRAARAPFTRVWWQDALEKTDGEILVDGDLLSWSYIEAGLISAVSLTLVFFVVLNHHGISPQQARVMAKGTNTNYFNKDSPDFT
ncbi:hypothetical protein GGH92_009707, partial [Coemansia sp. RSA 2673]